MLGYGIMYKKLVKYSCVPRLHNNKVESENVYVKNAYLKISKMYPFFNYYLSL